MRWSEKSLCTSMCVTGLRLTLRPGNEMDELVCCRLPWVTSKDMQLFQLLEEHARLRADPGTSNWYFTFTSSIDLKAGVANHLEKRILPRRVVEAIQGNTFPLLDINLDATYELMAGLPTLKFIARLTNAGGAPAFNCRIHWENKRGESQDKTIVLPGQSISMSLLYRAGLDHHEAESFIVAEYECPIGIAVHDRFRVHGYIQNDVLFSGATLVERKFFRCPKLAPCNRGRPTRRWP